MSKKANPLSIALGAVLVTGLGASGIANSAEEDADLFSMEELTSGYLTAGGHSKPKDDCEGHCGGEGKCGSA